MKGGEMRRRRLPKEKPESQTSVLKKDQAKKENYKPRKIRKEQGVKGAALLSPIDVFLLLFGTVIAIFTRFYRLDQPPAVVFDELHFSKFIDRQLSNVWFFDIHPPLGKLILAYGASLFGYKPIPSFVIEKIGHVYPRDVKYVIIRCISATFSVATVPMTYVISRGLQLSRASSTFAMAAVLTDFLGIIEGRLILMDSQLLFFCQLALFCALQLWKAANSNSNHRSLWLALTGLAAGTSFSIKHTALATPGLIAVISFFGIHFLAEPLTLLECAFATLIGFSVYATSFFVLFKTLWRSGGKYDNFMPLHFQKTLINSAHYDPAAKRQSFWRLFGYLNWRMVASNAGIKKRHTWESVWYHWIINWRGVLYYILKSEKDGVVRKARIYLIGNPIVLWLVLGCVVSFAILMIVVFRYRRAVFRRHDSTVIQKALGTCSFLLSGWLCNLLPYVLVDRAAFIYHYMPGLFYGQLLSAALVDLFPPKLRMATVAVATLAMFAALVYWSPWIYGIPLTDEENAHRRWLPRWN